MIRFRLALLLTLCWPGSGLAQQVPGFTAAAAGRQLALERTLDSLIRPATVREDSRRLSAVPHVAGTPAQSRTAAYVLQQLARAGFDTLSLSFRVYIPFQDSAVVELVKPAGKRFNLMEPPIREDPATQGGVWPAMNGYSGVGDVTGAVVYVNYGLPGDYALLDSLGVTVRGRVALARYGRSHRGVKAREAEAHGAAALLLYSDPQDDGYFLGLTYPNGPMRHPDSPQRGSLGIEARGDQSTPGWASTPDGPRLPQDSIPGPRIPVLPLGYRNAQTLLQALTGPEVPQAWQGGLPFRYRVGQGEVVVRVGVWAERGARASKTITNTVAVMRGTTWPDRWVLAGGHRDAWGPGAADNVSGVSTILEAGRAIGRAAAAGVRPKRTIVLATWDGEEWGLVGSIEQVELLADTLRNKAVAYLNLDVSANGRTFHAAGTASLWTLLRDVAEVTRQPGESLSVYQAWRRESRVADSASVPIGSLGGGSDFAGFYNVLGIPSFELGFGGRYGVYHSAYDTYNWMDRYGDPGYLSHAAAARMTAIALTRLANADLLPFDYLEFGRVLALMAAARRAEADRAGISLEGWARLDSATSRLIRAGEALDAYFRQLDAGAPRRPPSPAAFAAANDSLRLVEQAFVRPEGLPGRPFYKNLLFAPGRDDGYGAVALPGIADAISDRNAGVANGELDALATRTDRAAQLVEAALAALRPPTR